ncbi:MAG: hypothetical protein KKA62_00615 [Nanoarchaeota archaeon]|nr:hypothetical protein [Nanoarchaeota archaeon]MBU1644351.1 hypothetical protein [Nanoarchaeota archaeon]MBU1976436.1 hypothetical protein [Nanoarchaeota archaeon]
MAKIKVFKNSPVLKEIIESTGWSLYDISLKSAGNPLTAYRKQPVRLKEIEKKGPALNYQKGREYLVAPLQKEGRTLEESCAETGFLGPSLWLPDSNILNYFGFRGIQIENSGVYLFSRICFSPAGKDEHIVAYCPPGVNCPESTKLEDLPRIMIPSELVIDTFMNHFRITRREELAAAQYSNLLSVSNVDTADN